MTKILLVEDDKSLREIYGTRLLAEGYDIVSASDGEQGLAMALKEHPDLIVSDVMMPKISGFEMLDLLKSNEGTKNIKVIMMTALSSDNQRDRGQSLGADLYLVKSQVGIEDLVRSVHEVLGDQVGAAIPAPNQSPVNPPAATQPAVVAAEQMTTAAPYGTTPTATVQPEPALPVNPLVTPVSAPPLATPTAAPPGNPIAPGATALPQPGAAYTPSVDLAQSGSSIKTRIIQPTGESLNPKVDIESLLAKEEAAAPNPITPDQPPPTPDAPPAAPPNPPPPA